MSKWMYVVYSIPIIIGLLFLISIIYTKESKAFRAAQALGYGACNMGAIISFAILLFFMIITVILLQIMAYSDLYSNSEVCVPILYYMGNTDTCKKTIARSVDIQSQAGQIQQSVTDAKSYKSKNVDSSYYGKIEGFQTNVKKTLWKFSDLINHFYKIQYIIIKHGVTYIYKMYYDLFFPWMHR